jgi:hypothetical protein
MKIVTNEQFDLVVSMACRQITFQTVLPVLANLYAHRSKALPKR